MKPKFLHLFTQALDNLKLNELSQQLQSAISSETVVVDKAPLLLCSEFLKEALVPVIFNVISEAELFGLIEKDAGKNAALRRLKPSEAIDMFLDEIRSKEDHAKKLVLILEKMGRTETVREMQSIWKAGGNTKVIA